MCAVFLVSFEPQVPFQLLRAAQTWRVEEPKGHWYICVVCPGLLHCVNALQGRGKRRNTAVCV